MKTAIKIIKKIIRLKNLLNSNQRNLVFYSFTLLVCLMLLSKIQPHIHLLSNIDWWYFVMLFSFDLLFLTIHSVQHYHILSLLKKRLSFGKVAAITTISCLYNQLLPYQGSTFIKGALVKKKLGISWTDVVVAIGGFYVFSNIALGLIILIGSGIVFWDVPMSNDVYIYFLGFILIIMLGVYGMIWTKKRPELQRRFQIVGLTFKVLNRFDVYHLDYRKNIEVMVLQVIKLTVISLKLFTIFIILGVSVPFWKVFLVQSVIAISLPITVTPGNLGIKEGILVLFSSFLLVNPEIALFAGVLNRLMSVTSFSVSGSMSHLYLTRYNGSKQKSASLLTENKK